MTVFQIYIAALHQLYVEYNNWCRYFRVDKTMFYIILFEM